MREAKTQAHLEEYHKGGRFDGGNVTDWDCFLPDLTRGTLDRFCRCLVDGAVEAIAHTANCLEVDGPLRIRFDLLAQAAHEDVD